MSPLSTAWCLLIFNVDKAARKKTDGGDVNSALNHPLDSPSKFPRGYAQIGHDEIAPALVV